jgi:hypothetical protein
VWHKDRHYTNGIASSHIWSTDLQTRVPKPFIMEKTVSSTNDAEKNGYPNVKE